jgi:hypothetical protein
VQSVLHLILREQAPRPRFLIATIAALNRARFSNHITTYRPMRSALNTPHIFSAISVHRDTTPQYNTDDPKPANTSA